ncbi:MAG TPA: PTS transporter subunit IIC [Pelolinea sp.]|nr:PTS transporter subunit IIC [Pelolinea sp.]
MLDFIMPFFEAIYNLGPVLMVPAIMLLLGLIFGMGFKSSLRAALLTGIGFAGVYLILDFFLTAVGDVGMALSARFGGATTFLDAGWSTFAAIGWASNIGLIFIPIGIVSNLLLLLLGLTKVLNVNIWDYWESIIAGVIVQTLTGNFVFGLVFATLVHVINLKVGDWTQHLMHDYFGFEGIASYAAGYAEWGLIGKPIVWLIDRIPGLKKAKITPEELTDRYGVFGEPIFIGSVIGLVMGLLAGETVGSSLMLAINLAAVMYIQPKMISILMEGLVPISEGAQEFLEKKAPGRDLFIGLDPAIGTGDATSLAVCILMVPVAIFLALVLPGSKVMPLGDLTFIVFFSMWAAALCKGDLVKSFLTTTVFVIFCIYAGSYTAPVMNQIAQESGLLPPEQAGTMVTHFANGFYPHSLIATFIGKLFGGG